MTRGRRRFLVLAVVAGVGAIGAIGWAFFAAPGSGSAGAAVTALGTPTGVAASATGSTVHVTWTGVAAPDGSATVGYWVQRYVGSSPTNVCGSSQAAPIALGTGAKSCDDASVASGTYTYKVTAVFRSWTTASAASGTVTVAGDTTAPVFGSPALTITPSGAFTFVSGTTVYYNAQAANSGSFTVAAANVNDPESGIAKVNFPALTGITGGGDDPSSPYQGSYAWTAGSTAAGGQTVTAYNGTGLTSTASFTTTRDVGAPTGGSITANGAAAFNTTGTVAITKSDFTDAGAGIATNAITRSVAFLSGNLCGAFSGATPVTLSMLGNDSALLPTGCYQYTLTGTDNVGNQATATSTVVKVDTTAPTYTVTATGTNVKAVGTTVFYKSGAGVSGSFTVTAADTETAISTSSFPTIANWTQSGTGNTRTYTLTTSASGSSSPSFSATNNAALTTNQSVSLTLDNTGPVNAISVASATNAFISGTTLFYKGNAAGSFTLTNATTDTGSGPASSTYPAIATTGWTHNSETVSTPAGGPYASLAYAWTANPTNPTGVGRNIVATDAVGNTTSTTITFASDTAVPTATITFPLDARTYNAAGWNAGCATAGICGTATDAASGVASVAVTVKRLSDNNFWNGSAWQSGSFALPATGTTSWSQALAAANLTTGLQYTVTAQSLDNVGNASVVDTNTFTYDATPPSISNVVLQNKSGGTAGTVEKDDQVIITFSEQMSVNSLCSTWPTTGDGANQSLGGNGVVTITVTDGPSNTNDTLTVTTSSCGFGVIDLGSNAYVSGGNATFSGNGSNASSVAWTTATHVLTVNLGSKGGPGTPGAVVSSTPIYTAPAAVTDSAGNTLANSAFTLPLIKHF